MYRCLGVASIAKIDSDSVEAPARAALGDNDIWRSSIGATTSVRRRASRCSINGAREMDLDLVFAFGKGPGKVEVDPDGPAHSGIDRHDRCWNRDQRVVDARNRVAHRRQRRGVLHRERQRSVAQDLEYLSLGVNLGRTSVDDDAAGLGNDDPPWGMRGSQVRRLLRLARQTDPPLIVVDA